MKNKFLILITASALAFYGCKKTDADTGITVNATAPTIVTNDAVVTGTTASLGGNITSDGGSMVSESGICYSSESGVDTSDNKMAKYAISGNFALNVSGLTYLSTYYYRAYAINEKGLVYGEEKSFFVPIPGYPTADDVAASNLVDHWAFEDNYTDAESGTVGTASNAANVSFVSSGLKGKAVQVTTPGYVNTNMASTIAGLGSITISCWIQQPASLSSGPSTYFPFSLNKAGYSWEQTKFFTLYESETGANSYGKVCVMDQWFDAGRVWPKMLEPAWHHLAVSYDGTTGALRVYVDGAPLPQSANTTFNTQANFGDADSFTLGGPDDNAHTANGWMNSLSGYLDECRVYSKALSANEVQILFSLESHGF